MSTDITAGELLKAIEEVKETTDDVDLFEFASISEDALNELISKASTPLSEEEATYLSTGIIIALRAVKNRANSD